MTPYHSYKPSGIEWLGDIPEHWGVKKIKFSDDIIMGQSPDSEDYNLDYKGLPFLQGNADFTELFPKPRIWCTSVRKIAKNNDILVSVRAPVGEVNVADQEYGIGRGLCAIRERKTDFKLLYYILCGLKDELNSIATGSTFTAVSVEDIRNLSIPQLNHLEQSKLSGYLDHRTHLIDTLISKKQKLIDLLKEYRTAIINQAVTKGLDPNVKMKDSGIEWLGEVPEHWEVKRVSTLGRFSKGRGISKDQTVLSGVPCIRYGEIYTKYNRIVYQTVSFITKETSLFCESIKKGDVLFTGSGETAEEIGKSVVYYGTDEAFAGGDIIIIKLNDQSSPLFISYLMNCSYVIHQKSLMGKGEIIVHIYPNQIKEILISLPPAAEQNSIVEFLDKKTTSIDIQIEKEQKLIEYLKEYRTALISEVVTGKVDVRGL